MICLYRKQRGRVSQSSEQMFKSLHAVRSHLYEVQMAKLYLKDRNRKISEGQRGGDRLQGTGEIGVLRLGR